MQNPSYDIVIIGGGPAGAIAAGQLAGSGLSVLVVEANENTVPKWENLLPMAAARVLDQCGLWERFQTQNHQPLAGIQMAWGNRRIKKKTTQTHHHNQIFQLHTHPFEAMLLDYARESGAEVWRGADFQECNPFSQGWIIEVAQEGQKRKVQARYLMDASGTKRAVQTKLGVPFQLEDEQECWIMEMAPPIKAAQPIESAVVEATANGWWYAIPRPEGHMQVLFFTQATEPGLPQDQLQIQWKAEKERTIFLKTLFDQQNLKEVGKGEILAITIGRTAQIAGEDWCAIGDAAITFDPLSSQGLLSALYAGIRIKDPVQQWLQGNRTPMTNYTENQLAIYQSYLANHSQLYFEEKRWPQSPFWKQRQTR